MLLAQSLSKETMVCMYLTYAHTYALSQFMWAHMCVPFYKLVQDTVCMCTQMRVFLIRRRNNTSVCAGFTGVTTVTVPHCGQLVDCLNCTI